MDKKVKSQWTKRIKHSGRKGFATVDKKGLSRSGLKSLNTVDKKVKPKWTKKLKRSGQQG